MTSEARTALAVTARWTKAHPRASTPVHTSTAATFAFSGPLVLNARLKRPPRVPKSNGEMEDLGGLTLDQRRLLPERDILDTLRYASCAVVGNGGLLLMYQHGDIIDSHDAAGRPTSAAAFRVEGLGYRPQGMGP